MISMGIRELRANLGAVVHRVRGGETVEVTEHGHPVARLVPLHQGRRYEQMVVEGRIIPAEDSFADILDSEPLPLPAGQPSLSEILAELRADER